MSVFDNWRAIHKARFMTDPTQQLLANKKITSHQMIFYLADVCGVSYETVKKVIDGFWDYVSDATNHHVKHSKRYLVIPHFGTFRRVTGTSKGMPKEKLRFRSLSVAQLSERLARSPGAVIDLGSPLPAKSGRARETLRPPADRRGHLAKSRCPTRRGLRVALCHARPLCPCLPARRPQDLLVQARRDVPNQIWP